MGGVCPPGCGKPVTLTDLAGEVWRTLISPQSSKTGAANNQRVAIMTGKHPQFHLAILALAIGCLLPGCDRQPTSAPPPATDRLVGLSVEELKAELGEPDSAMEMTGRPDFGPYPKGLAEGTPCICLNYADHQGQQLHIYCVSPDVYQEATGKNRGDKDLYVLEVFSYPKGTVF